MSNSKISIVGNGFDLNHGLKTSYIDFSEWGKNYSDIFNKIDEMINENNEIKYIDDEIGWFDFENSLHKLIQNPVFEDHVEQCKSYLMGYGDHQWSDSAHYDFQYKVYNYVIPCEELQKYFKEWICEEVCPTIERLYPIYEFSNDSLFSPLIIRMFCKKYITSH